LVADICSEGFSLEVLELMCVIEELICIRGLLLCLRVLCLVVWGDSLPLASCGSSLGVCFGFRGLVQEGGGSCNVLVCVLHLS